MIVSPFAMIVSLNALVFAMIVSPTMRLFASPRLTVCKPLHLATRSGCVRFAMPLRAFSSSRGRPPMPFPCKVAEKSRGATYARPTSGLGASVAMHRGGAPPDGGLPAPPRARAPWSRWTSLGRLASPCGPATRQFPQRVYGGGGHGVPRLNR